MAPQNRAQTQGLQKPGEAVPRVESGFRDETYLARPNSDRLSLIDFAGIGENVAKLGAIQNQVQYNKDFEAGQTTTLQEYTKLSEEERRDYIRKERDMIRNGTDPTHTEGFHRGRRLILGQVWQQEQLAATAERMEQELRNGRAAAELGKNYAFPDFEKVYTEIATEGLQDDPLAEDGYFRRGASKVLEERYFKMQDAYQEGVNNAHFRQTQVNVLTVGTSRLVEVANAKESERADLISSNYAWSEETLRDGNFPDPRQAVMDMFVQARAEIVTAGRDAGQDESVITDRLMDLFGAYADASVGNQKLAQIPAFAEMYGNVFIAAEESAKEGTRLAQKADEEVRLWQLTEGSVVDRIKLARTAAEVNEVLEAAEDDLDGLGEFAGLKIDLARNTAAARNQSIRARQDGVKNDDDKTLDMIKSLASIGATTDAQILLNDIEDPNKRKLGEYAITQEPARKFEAVTEGRPSYLKLRGSVEKLPDTLIGGGERATELRTEIEASISELEDNLREALSDPDADYVTIQSEHDQRMTMLKDDFTKQTRDLNEKTEAGIVAVQEALRVGALGVGKMIDDLDVSPELREKLLAANKAVEDEQNRLVTGDLLKQAISRFTDDILTSEEAFGDLWGVPVDDTGITGNPIITAAGRRELDKLESAFQRAVAEKTSGPEWRAEVARLSPALKASYTNDTARMIRDEVYTTWFEDKFGKTPEAAYEASEAAEKQANILKEAGLPEDVRQSMAPFHQESDQFAESTRNRIKYGNTIALQMRSIRETDARTLLINETYNAVGRAPKGLETNVDNKSWQNGRVQTRLANPDVRYSPWNDEVVDRVRAMFTNGAKQYPGRFRQSPVLDAAVREVGVTSPIMYELGRIAGTPGLQERKAIEANQLKVRDLVLKNLGESSPETLGLAYGGVAALAEATWVTKYEVIQGRIGSFEVTNWDDFHPVSVRYLTTLEDFYPENYRNHPILEKFPGLDPEDFLDMQLALD